MKRITLIFHKLGDPSLILAITSTIIYYAVVFQPAFRSSLLFRYTAEHVVEYGVVFLFFWGMCDMAVKFAGFPREFLALKKQWMPPKTRRESVANAEVYLKEISKEPKWKRDSRVGRRLTAVLDFVVNNSSADELGEHIRYRSEHDEEQTHRHYAVTRFVVAVTPILGFLGTVVHFGTALNGLTFSDVDSELSHVAAEMGTAFNTTAIALGSAMITMFVMFLCERVEHGIVNRINRIVELDFNNRFEIQNSQLAPLCLLLAQANEKSQLEIRKSAEQQLQIWVETVERLAKRMDTRQEAEERRWVQTLEVVHEQHSKWNLVHENRFQVLSDTLDARQSVYAEQLRSALEQATGFGHLVESLIATLNQIALGEGRLIELQASLSANLRLLRESGQIDGAWHGLTAAIHLLTLRNGESEGDRRAA